MPRPRPIALATAIALPLVVSAVASAAVVFATLGPFGGFFGLWGADLNPQQRAAERFIPAADHVLDDARFWLMNNSGSSYGQVKVRLELDATEVGMGGLSRPSGIALEEWNFGIQTLGWNPVQHTMASAARPPVRAGRKYWIVASSQAPNGQNPVWNFASSGNAYTAISQLDGSWAAGNAAALTLTVNGTPGAPKRGDINRDGTVGPKDIAAMLSAWGASQPVAGDADANQDGVVDALDIPALLSNWG
jgi:hypothetical protein